jgi:hypothetical protein
MKTFNFGRMAEKFARDMNAPNTIAHHRQNEDGSFSPVILLREDQLYMAKRIRERGIIPITLSHENWKKVAEIKGVQK